MRKMSMKKNAKKVLAFALAAAMIVPVTFIADGTDASAETTPAPVAYFDLERGFRGDGTNEIILDGQELKAISVGHKIQYEEAVDEQGRLPLNSEGEGTGEYTKASTVWVSKSWTQDKTGKNEYGYSEVAIPAGAPQQFVPTIHTDNGQFNYSCSANQATTAYDETKGNVFWMGETMINESYPTYATVVDWENGTYITDQDVIVKDMADDVQDFEITNSATKLVNPYTGSSATGFAFSTWVKNTNEYEEPAEYSILGDVAVDGQINANDALAVLKHAAKVAVLDANGMLFADVNGDKEVNANDALDILKYAAKMITEFKGETPVISGGNEETVSLLGNAQFLHFENREEHEVQEWYTVLDRTKARGYLYFSANSVVFVKDYTDATKTCTWTLAEDLQGDDLDLLSQKNGGSWNYLTYSFDGTDFHMYVNGQERTLTKVAADGYTTAGEDILAFVKDADTEAFFGGLGGGMKDNFNTFAIETSDDYYIDDMALYGENLSAETAAAVYTAAADKMEKEVNRTVNMVKSYAFEGANLAANELLTVDGATSSMLPTVEKDVDGRTSVLKTTTSAQTSHGGTYFAENPFAGNDELTGITVSYWMKAIANKRGAVTDGVLVSFIDEAKSCTHPKVSEAYLNENSIARSQLYLNVAFEGDYSEGVTKPIGGNSLKNIYSFRMHKFGDPQAQTDERKVPLAQESWDNWKAFCKTLDDKWYYVTVTINNAGFKMYIDGEEVENKYSSYNGPRFFDGCWDRIEDEFVAGTHNSGARSLMDFITDETTKIYIGYAYEQGSEQNFRKSTNCYLDDLSFYDAAMTSEEVKALYEAAK